MNRPSSSETVVLLVHGAWHNALHWTSTQRALARHGLASIAIDLPGSGLDAPVPTGYLQPGQPGLTSEKSALSDVTTQDSANAVLDALAGARTRYRNVVLVAHSAGGSAASAAAEQAPELLDHLVYLSAFVPAGRPRFADYIEAEENADAVRIPPLGDPAELGAVRINPLSPDPAAIELIRRAFLNDLPASSPDSWRQFLHPDHPFSSMTTPVPVTAGRWGRLPRTFIRLTEDLALPPVTQDLMIAEANQVVPDNPIQVRSLPGGHSPFATRPAELAAVLTEIALARTLP
ncbi:Lysophospholipase, alpha-beta hydrolase superfamily [Saccharopolyspora kobensis]|uniref:Lysophospholipase, alpha-beta hydrolase superfamily n=1 Tax=Saccharopolyspora kobensis TaxID=146035 RepID=A0A1H6AJG3_9PSEU|nr:alpha/beta fold hydrolase [Saccharopolyspora kobensis]SEG48380.1 Lysophospholipase, alpha-beta hydrolase superfamily [Saccharopolyspora kobensis]SFE57728.1 Lysophospholipase, alpha-beta hydrolase superfamily [Saccharopolyspora kobensis]